MARTRGRLATLASAFFLAGLAGCNPSAEPKAEPEAAPGSSSAGPTRPEPPLLISLATFTTTREAYEKRIIPQFQRWWRKTHGREVQFTQSYVASHVQATAIADGFEADVAALSLERDLDLLVQKGLIRGEWRKAPHGGIVCRSVTVLAVRKGNPLGISDWPDLAAPGVRVLMPDPRTSGGGKWDVCAIWGAALRGRAGVPAGDREAAEALFGRILANVAPFEKDARGSFKAFEGGEGDVAVTSESEATRGRMFGHEHEVVIPPCALRVDNPAAVVDVYAEKHGVQEVARAFLEYLWTPEAQRAFAFYGFRPVDETLAQDLESQYPVPADLWSIDELGGWSKMTDDLLGPGGVLERVTSADDAR